MANVWPSIVSVDYHSGLALQLKILQCQLYLRLGKKRLKCWKYTCTFCRFSLLYFLLLFFFPLGV